MFYLNKVAHLLVFLSIPFLSTAGEVEQEDTITAHQATVTAEFTPPKGWRLAEPDSLPRSVHIMVVGKGSHPFPPSINLGTEKYKGTLKEYLHIVKAINDAEGAEWKGLGDIHTQAGIGSLSQVNTITEWGPIKMMHVILLREGTVYILTAAALEEEFNQFYPDFFKAMRSLRIGSN